jgi:hypothetical protein
MRELAVLTRVEESWSVLHTSRSEDRPYVKWSEVVPPSAGFYVKPSRDAAWEWMSLGEEAPAKEPRCYVDSDTVIFESGEDTWRLPGSIEVEVTHFDWDLDAEVVLACTRDEVIVWKGFSNNPSRLPFGGVVVAWVFGPDHFVCDRRDDMITLHSAATGELVDQMELEGLWVTVNGRCERILDYTFRHATLIGREGDTLVALQSIRPEQTPIQPYTTWSKIKDAWFPSR